MSQSTVMERVYVWEGPVRLFHWVNALALVALVATGLIIGRPLSLQVEGGEASFSYYFGWVRFIHFVAAFVFFFNFLARVYWGFVGNEYARWSHYLPLTPAGAARQWREVMQVIKIDILHMPGPPLESVGHNALAAWIYLLMFLAIVFQAVTGFGMYSAMSQSWLPALFAWIVPLMGGDFAVRQWHHMGMWFFILFTMFHVYLVFYHDYLEGRGVISSIAGGWKFVERQDDDKPRAE